MDNKPNTYWHWATMCILFVAMVAMFRFSVPLAAAAWMDGSSRTEQAEKASVDTTVSFAELEAATTRLNDEIATLPQLGFEAYFDFLSRCRVLERTMRVIDREGGDYRVRSLMMRLRMVEEGGANAFLPTLRDNVNLTRDPAFAAAQQRAVAADKVAVADAPAAYAFGSVAYQLALSLLACLPFALLSVALQVQRTTEASWLSVAVSFTSDWRLLAAALTGPFAAFFVAVLFLNRERLAVNFRYLTYALGGLLSCFIGGAGAGAVKAQSVDGKKATVTRTSDDEADSDATPSGKKNPWRFAAVQRVESDPVGKTASTSIFAASNDRSGTSLEGIVVKGSGFMRTYGLAVQRLKTWKGRVSGSVSSITGAETFSAGGATDLYVVLGARVKLERGRFSLSVPHAALEPSVTGRPMTSAIIARPTFRASKRFSLVNEWFARATKNAKTKWYTGAFGVVPLSSRLSFEFGPFVTSSKSLGVRAQVGFSF